MNENNNNTLFRFLSFSDVFRTTYAIFMERVDLFLILSSIVIVPTIAVFISILLIFVSVLMPEIEEEEKEMAANDNGRVPYRPYENNDDQMQKELHNEILLSDHFLAIGVLLMAYFIIYPIITTIARGAMIRAVADYYIHHSDTSSNCDTTTTAVQLDQRITWKQCLRLSFLQLGSLLGGNILIACFIAMSGFLPLIFGTFFATQAGAFGIFLAIFIYIGYFFFCVYSYVSFTAVSPTIMVEKKSAKESLWRSWELATNHRCYLLCSFFVMWVLHHLLTNILHVLFNSRASNNTNNIFAFLSNVDGIIITMIPMLIFFPLYSILETVLYFSIRVQRESLNRDVLIRDLDKEIESNMLMMMIGRDGSTTDSHYSPPTNGNYAQVPLMESEHQLQLQVEQQHEQQVPIEKKQPQDAETSTTIADTAEKEDDAVTPTAMV